MGDHGGEALRKKFSDPRIHMAIVCASIGCPYLRNEVFSGAKLDEQLDAQTRKFLGDPEKFRIDRKAEKAYLSPIFDWFGEDFISGYGTEAFGKRSKAERAVLHFISQYVGGEDQTYLRAGDYRVAWLDYDWSLNAQD